MATGSGPNKGIASIADRAPELFFRLQYGDSDASLQLDFLSKSQPLLQMMMEKGDEVTGSLGVLLALSEKKNTTWLKRILPGIRRQGKHFTPLLQSAIKLLGVRTLATDGGNPKKDKFIIVATHKGTVDNILNMDEAPMLYGIRVVERAAAGAKNTKLESEGLRKEIENTKPSAEEIRETLRSIPAEERERRRRELKEMGLPYSNEDVAATFINGTEAKHTWQVNAAYGILTRKDVRRERPQAEKEIKDTIAKLLKSGKPLHLVGIWGGFKDSETMRADMADESALDLIKETRDSIKELGIGVVVTLLFADVHASNPLLGRTKILGERGTFEYMDDIAKLCDARGFEITALSRMYGAASMFFDRPESKKYSFEKISEEDIELGIYKSEKFMATDAAKDVIEAAKKYSDHPEKVWSIAMNYVAVRIYESRALERTFPDSLFFAYGRPEYEFQPKKILFWHSLKGGINKPPWFIDAEKELK